MNDIDNAVPAKKADLQSYHNIAGLLSDHITEGIAIAFSGGVDSSLLLKIACDIAKKRNHSILAITFDTKLHPHGDLEEARRVALSLGAIHKTIEVDEFSDPEIMNLARSLLIISWFSVDSICFCNINTFRVT